MLPPLYHPLLQIFAKMIAHLQNVQRIITVKEMKLLRFVTTLQIVLALGL